MSENIYDDWETSTCSTIDLGENAKHFNTLCATIEASRIIYVSVGGKKYLLSDLIKAYDAVGKKKCRIRKGKR